eukprot:12340085-Heterocapsa_arctica.AAC.1
MLASRHTVLMSISFPPPACASGSSPLWRPCGNRRMRSRPRPRSPRAPRRARLPPPSCMP